MYVLIFSYNQIGISNKHLSYIYMDDVILMIGMKYVCMPIVNHPEID